MAVRRRHRQVWDALRVRRRLEVVVRTHPDHGLPAPFQLRHRRLFGLPRVRHGLFGL